MVPCGPIPPPQTLRTRLRARVPVFVNEQASAVLSSNDERTQLLHLLRPAAAVWHGPSSSSLFAIFCGQGGEKRRAFAVQQAGSAGRLRVGLDAQRRSRKPQGIAARITHCKRVERTCALRAARPCKYVFCGGSGLAACIGIGTVRGCSAWAICCVAGRSFCVC